MQFIKVELGFASPRPYTYGWDGGEIERNDFVVVPPNSYSPYPGIGRVLRVMKTPDFTGLLTVLRQKASLETLQVSVQQGSAEPDVPPGWEGVL